jgi:transcriptional regulator with XRE-family HTH domain
MSILMEKIGNRIRTLRTGKGFKQETMAEMLGMSLSGYAKIERGETDLNISRLEDIAKVLEIQPSDLIRLSEGGLFFNYNNAQNSNYEYQNITAQTFYNQSHIKEEIEELRKIVMEQQQMLLKMMGKLGDFK